MKNICYLLRAGEVESLVGRQDPQQELVQQLDRAAGVANTSAETGVIGHIYLGSQRTFAEVSQSRRMPILGPPPS